MSRSATLERRRPHHRRQGNPINFRSVEAERGIDARTLPDVRGLGRSGVAARDLERYYALLDGVMADVDYAEAEAVALVEASGHDLAVRLRAELDPCTAAAVLDAIERAIVVDAREHIGVAAAVRQVGLVKDG